MTPEEIKETIRDYPRVIKEIQRLRETLNKNHEVPGRNFFISVSSGYERKIKRLEQMERRVLGIQDLIESENLTDREWSFLDCMLSGMSITQASEHLCFSSRSGSRFLENIVSKIIANQQSG
ncbi:hypothetical protein [Cytobacillus praedii]|uniref:hypothetical protein n=1 Tax=Cytobacillus praedii TaxID=1742358 RepID=UPI002E246A35|nr:hypothetical protein [Cytobacillus praedii]